MKPFLILTSTALVSCMFFAGCSSFNKKTNVSPVYPLDQTSTSSASDQRSSQATTQSNSTNKYVTATIPYINNNGMPINSFFDLSFYSDMTFGQAISFEATFTKQLTGVNIVCENAARTQKKNILSNAKTDANLSIIIDIKHAWMWNKGDTITIKADGYNDFIYQLPISENEWTQFLYNNIENTKIKMAKLGKVYVYMDPNGNYHTMQSDSTEVPQNVGSTDASSGEGVSAASGSSGKKLSISERSFLKQQLQVSEKNLEDMQASYGSASPTQKPFIAETMKKQQKTIDEIKRKLVEQ